MGSSSSTYPVWAASSSGVGGGGVVVSCSSFLPKLKKSPRYRVVDVCCCCGCCMLPLLLIPLPIIDLDLGLLRLFEENATADSQDSRAADAAANVLVVYFIFDLTSVAGFQCREVQIYTR